jgi:arsenate reductase-like glutaredoxin family protein
VETKYVSFGGNYFFSVPAKYTADGTVIAGVTVVYPESSPLQNGQTLNDLYLKGAVAIQPIVELKDNNPEAFKNFVKDVLAADLRKTFKTATDLRPTKQKDVEAVELYAVGVGGKRLRADYAIDFTQPVLVVAQDYSEAFKTASLTMEDLKKSSLKPDIDQAAEVTKEIAQMLQKQNSTDLRKNATSEYKKKVTEKQLAESLQSSSKYLQRPISIVGGLYSGKFFIAQLVFEAATAGEQPMPAIVSLQKIGKTWRLDGLQLPK